MTKTNRPIKIIKRHELAQKLAAAPAVETAPAARAEHLEPAAPRESFVERIRAEWGIKTDHWRTRQDERYRELSQFLAV